MGNCCSHCWSCFRTKFRPSHESDRPLTTLHKDEDEPDDSKKNETTNLITDDEKIRLLVEQVDLYSEENGIAHKTSKFFSTQPRLIVRRGDAFKLKINFNREYRPEHDLVCLVFIVKDAKHPSYSQGTQISVPVEQTWDFSSTDSWRVEMVSKEARSIVLKITSPPTTIVGEWKLEIDTKELVETGRNPEKHIVNKPIYILFNPWCSDDTVYMPIDEQRNEYVLNDNGVLWRGSHNRLRPCMWNYGQYEEKVLECCCLLLSKIGKLSVVARSDPVKVVRHVSAVINSPDDNGVLEGNWSGNYKGGIPPTHWAGSKTILQQFHRTKKPVKFGQCWVFSAVCTTVVRALGIPARPVTNFSSAHDTHNSLTIDQFYDKEGNPVDRLNVDSIWNFHVWNEVWMQRPDLNPEYGGWQAIDSTPQEESDGMFRCGPASLVAVKRGEILKPYDVPFVFSEVNADKVNWFYHGPNQPLKLIFKSTESIGQHISTKAIGSNERDDITSNYKHQEGSKEEREVMLRALRQTKNVFSRYYLNEEMEDVAFDFLLLDDIVIGSPFTVRLKAKNKSSNGKTYTVSVVLRVDTVLYTGKLKNLVKKDKFDVELEPGTEEEMLMTVSYTEYQKALVDQCAFNIAAMAHVQETNFDYFAQDDFRVRMPDITIETEGEFIEMQEFTVEAKLKNPLPKPLHRGLFYLEGPGLGEPLKIKVKKTVPPGDEARVIVKMTPRTPGEKTIVVKFHSKEIDDADGFKTIIVKPQIDKTSNGQ